MTGKAAYVTLAVLCVGIAAMVAGLLTDTTWLVMAGGGLTVGVGMWGMDEGVRARRRVANRPHDERTGL